MSRLSNHLCSLPALAKCTRCGALHALRAGRDCCVPRQTAFHGRFPHAAKGSKRKSASAYPLKTCQAALASDCLCFDICAMFSSSIRLLAFATFSLAPVASAAPTLQVRAASRNGFPALVDDGPNSEYQACMLAITNLPPIIDANGKPTEIGGANDRCVKGCRPGKRL